jgi:hypothetical protein
MTPEQWAVIWGTNQPYFHNFGIPTRWREMHMTGRVLGAARTPELPHPDGVVQAFVHGYILWPSGIGRLYVEDRARPTQPSRSAVRVPAGITVHLTGSECVMDGAGVLFCRTQAQSPVREVVWRVKEGRVLDVWDPGNEDAYGNGSFSVLAGELYLTAINEARQMVLLKVPGWTRP